MRINLIYMKNNYLPTPMVNIAYVCDNCSRYEQSYPVAIIRISDII